MYKTLTGIIYRSISLHFEEHNLLSAEDKGCHSGGKGCKDQLLISEAIFEETARREERI